MTQRIEPWMYTGINILLDTVPDDSITSNNAATDC